MRDDTKRYRGPVRMGTKDEDWLYRSASQGAPPPVFAFKYSQAAENRPVSVLRKSKGAKAYQNKGVNRFLRRPPSVHGPCRDPRSVETHYHLVETHYHLTVTVSQCW